MPSFMIFFYDNLLIFSPSFTLFGFGNLHSPCCCSFSKKLHESSLHHQPEHTRKVEQKPQEYEIERHPLVVRIIDDGVGVIILVSPRAGTLVLPGDVPGAVHPAVGLQHILLYTSTSLSKIRCSVFQDIKQKQDRWTQERNTMVTEIQW